MKIIRRSFSELSIIDKIEIDQFVNLHNGLIFHETKFNEIALQTFKTKLSYFLAYKEKKLIGICPIHSTKSGVLTSTFSSNGSFEIPYGGWVYDNKYTIFQKLWNRTSVNLFESFTYASSFLVDIPEKIKKTSKEFQTGLVDLGISEDDIFNNVVHSKRRNMVRKGEKSGIIIKNHGREGLPIYYDLMKEMRRKTRLNEKPYDYYENILSAYVPEKAVISIAYLEEKPLAGAIIIGNKNAMHYWQGASVYDVPNLGQGEMLQWNAIKWAKNSGAKFYDLCVIEPDRLPHIAQFKMGFSKELASFYYFVKKSFPFRVTNRIQNAFFN